MSIAKIQQLSMNPHFYALLIQSFLSGYGSTCEIKTTFLVLPMLLYAKSREKLITANRSSRMDTLFHSALYTIENVKMDSKIRLAGYSDRYSYLLPYSKKALIILYSEGKITIENHLIKNNKIVDYKKYNGIVNEWLKSAYYLGIIFSKTSKSQLSYYLGVDVK